VHTCEKHIETRRERYLIGEGGACNISQKYFKKKKISHTEGGMCVAYRRFWMYEYIHRLNMLMYIHSLGVRGMFKGEEGVQNITYRKGGICII